MQWGSAGLQGQLAGEAEIEGVRERDYNQLVSERRLFSSNITSTGELSIWDRAHVSNHPTLPLIPGG